MRRSRRPWSASRPTARSADRTRRAGVPGRCAGRGGGGGTRRETAGGAAGRGGSRPGRRAGMDRSARSPRRCPDGATSTGRLKHRRPRRVAGGGGGGAGREACRPWGRPPRPAGRDGGLPGRLSSPSGRTSPATGDPGAPRREALLLGEEAGPLGAPLSNIGEGPSPLRASGIPSLTAGASGCKFKRTAK